MIPLHQATLKLNEALAFPGDDYITRLKSAFKTRFHKDHVVFTADARNAICLALKALKLKPHDEVLIPGYICQAVWTAVAAVCRPVCVDIDQRTFNIDPEEIGRHITRNTKAILAAHLYGNPCAIDRIVDIARAHNLAIIEDAAQTLGGSYDGKDIGSFGDFTVFSFRFTKDINCFRGGALLSQEPVDAGLKPAASIKVTPGLLATLFALGQIRNTPAFVYSPLRRRLLFPYFSHNAARFDESPETLCNYQCYLLYRQLDGVETLITKRRENAVYYSERLRDVAVIPEETERGRHTYYRYTIQVDHRDELYNYLLKHGIEADMMYNYALGDVETCPQSVAAGRRNLNIPVHQGLAQADMVKVVETIHRFNESR